ncbi:MAG: xanthine dehydrogenase family protein molybdopterin-binding subunit [Desulfuromonadia bacterium]
MTVMTRREFLKVGSVALGGLVIAFHLPIPATASIIFEPNAFLSIGHDDRVTILIPKSESGQGVTTTLAMIVAEELGCDWEKVGCLIASPSSKYLHTRFPKVMVTGVDGSVSTEWDRLSRAGAAAREMLISAAATRWGVSLDLCRAEKGKVVLPDGRWISFGALVDDASRLPIPVDPPIKTGPSLILGRPLPRIDCRELVLVPDRFAIDLHEPGMLTAMVVHPPIFGAPFKWFDADMAREIQGVREIFSVDTGVAVVADGFWQAKRGAELVRPVWEYGDGVKRSTDAIRRRYRSLAKRRGKIALRRGDAPGALGKGIAFTALYDLPYLSPSPMEPLSALFVPRGDRWVVRVGTDTPFTDRERLAGALAVPADRIDLEVIPAGGSFGKRLFLLPDFLVEGGKIARRVNRPVKVVQSREEDIQGGGFRPIYLHRIAASVDSRGYPRAWLHRVVGQSVMTGTPLEPYFVRDGIDQTSVEGVVDTPYPIPHLQVELHSPSEGVPVGWWRGGGYSHSCFAMESMIDELAHRAGEDPLRYRRRLLAKEPRLLRLLEMVAEMGDWKKKPHPGVGKGVALCRAFGSAIALVAEVSFDSIGMIRVRRIVAAADCGRIVNPDILTAEIESGIVFGLSATLFGEITIRDGFVTQRNFDSYQLLRMFNTPPIEIRLVESNEPPGGASSLGVPPVAPAIANALYAGVRSRVRSLPITAEKVIASHARG